MRRIAGALFTTVVLAACGSSGSSSSSAPGTADPSSAETGGTEVLRPADDVRDEQATANIEVHELGERVKIEDVTVTITAIRSDTDADSTGQVLVDARVENSTSDELSVPGMAIACTGNEDHGGWTMDSTLELYSTLPAKSYDEGVVALDAPSDDNGNLVTCEAPAYVVVEPVLSLVNARDDGWQIPDDVLAAMNAEISKQTSATMPEIEDSAADTIVVPADPTVAVAREDAATGKDLTSPGQAVAALAEAGIDCPLAAKPADPTAIDLAGEMTGDEYSCSYGTDQKIEFSFYQDAATRKSSFEAIVAMFGPMVKQMGVTEISVAFHKSGNWIVTASPADDSPPRPEDMDLLDKLADALDGEVQTTKL